MYTGDVWGITLLLAGTLAALVAMQLLTAAVFARAHAGATRTLAARPTLSACAGVIVIVVLVLATMVLSAMGGGGKFLGALLFAAAVFPTAIGLSAVSRFVGERMPSPADAGRPWRPVLRGGVTCALAFLLPIVGWFLVLPAAIVSGLGALAASAFVPERSPAASPEATGAAA